MSLAGATSEGKCTAGPAAVNARTTHCLDKPESPTHRTLVVRGGLAGGAVNPICKDSSKWEIGLSLFWLGEATTGSPVPEATPRRPGARGRSGDLA